VGAKCLHSSLDVTDIYNSACTVTFLGFKLSLLTETGCENGSTAIFFNQSKNTLKSQAAEAVIPPPSSPLNRVLTSKVASDH